jgi:6-methylpretetramide 4-monooxygenase / 4-hydroxy-6-methylpretetramide 12a-monooxygenase
VDVNDASDPERVAARFAAKLRQGFGTQVRVHRPSWVSVFTIQQRMIQQMRVGRCFVAGDAAHVHSPASGQGMNTGVQDAFNLAWKIANVTHGVADEALLDSYAAERVPIGQALLGATRKATALVALKSAVASATMPAVFTVVRSVPAIRHRIERKIMRGMTGLAIGYPDSPLTVPAAGAPAPEPGTRVARVTARRAASSPGWQALLGELRDPRWTLLVLPAATDPAATDPAPRGPAPTGPAPTSPGQTEPARAGDGRPAEADELAAEHPWLSVRVDPTLAPDLGVDQAGGWLLIRPDGYLSARGRGTADLRTAVRAALARVGLRTGVPNRYEAV